MKTRTVTVEISEQDYQDMQKHLASPNPLGRVLVGVVSLQEPKTTEYNGWSNYETWAVNLWMTNDQHSDSYWREAATAAWERAGDGTPNQFMDREHNAQQLLADHMKGDHEEQVPDEAGGSVYADLLTSALSEVNWHEIAKAFLEDFPRE